jgi:N-terminal half of MaoC dehydratase
VSHISAEMSRCVGREFAKVVSFPVCESDIRRWAIAIYYPEPAPAVFLDAAVAAASPQGGIVAPEEFNPFAWRAAEVSELVPGVDPLDPDATEKRLGIGGPGLRNRLNGGLSVEYGVRMRPGDVIVSVSRVAEYREREGRLGLMLFTGLEDEWTNQRGELVRRFRMDLIRY